MKKSRGVYPSPRNLPRAEVGFSLIELAVGLAVGLFVSFSAIAVFSSTRISQKVNSEVTKMNENGRLVLDLLHRDLRSAGFVGCREQLAEPPVSLINPGNDRFLDTNSDPAGIRGFSGIPAGFSPSLNPTLSALSPNTTSDFISIRVPVEPMSLGLIVPMTRSTDSPQVGINTEGNTIKSGDIVLIASCKAAAIFQVTENYPESSGVLSHGVGGQFNPGNFSNDLMQVFRGDAAVYKLRTYHYFIAPGSYAGTNSMWRLTFPDPLRQNVAEEIGQGIDQMIITYGIGASSSQSVNRYVGAEAVDDWNSVLSVRIQILLSTKQDGTGLVRQSGLFAGQPVIPADRRLRTQLTEVIALRNRIP